MRALPLIPLVVLLLLLVGCDAAASEARLYATVEVQRGELTRLRGTATAMAGGLSASPVAAGGSSASPVAAGGPSAKPVAVPVVLTEQATAAQPSPSIATRIPVTPPPLPTLVTGPGTVLEVVDRLGTRASTVGGPGLPVTIEGDVALTTLARTSEGLVLQLNASSWLVIPYSEFRTAYDRGDHHVVTLASGRELVGDLVGTVRGTEQRMMDLASASTVVLSSLNRAPSPPPTPGTTQPIRWTYEPMPEHVLVRPALVGVHYSSVGYLIGGVTKASETGSFFMSDTRGAGHVLVNVVDFERLEFGENWAISGTAASGYSIQGSITSFAVPNEPNGGTVPVANLRAHYVVATVEGSAMRLIAKSPTGVLRRG